MTIEPSSITVEPLSIAAESSGIPSRNVKHHSRKSQFCRQKVGANGRSPPHYGSPSISKGFIPI
ncbi:MAG: hypothetical protein HC840_31000 [Leptolyngbyaceae cyanobacterium RM2_2_4]|nr:hypothetical protein [Leptolyngbyaceae cyanobacterium SM1_4_3]NJO53091.1 hypothetical protein [Leptolyngbyaceae cyanobacterium RM2_2_4]